MAKEFKTIEEFVSYLRSRNRDSNINIRGGEIYSIGDVRMYNDDIDEVPFKFEFVDGNIDVSNNNLKSFEFLPEDAKSYDISDNPGVTGILKEIIDKCSHWTFTKIFNQFIQNCLINDVWEDGVTNFDIIRETWKETKNDIYSEDKNGFMSRYYKLLDSNDIDLLADYYDVTGDIWSSDDILKRIFEKFSSDNSNERILNFRILSVLMSNDEDNKIKDLIVKSGYEKVLPYISLSERQDEEKNIQKVLYLLGKKVTRDKKTIKRDEENECLVFNASYEFIENDQGLFKKKLNIERLMKVDIYDASDLQIINMMKMRSRFQQDVETYFIWVPKGSFDEYIETNDIPDYILELIDKKKTRT